VKLLPRGRYLPVHSRSEPGRRIGWVPAPHVTAPRPIRFAIGHTFTDLWTGDVIPAGRLDTNVVWSLGSATRQLVVLSAGQPLDLWRRVPGFLAETRCPIVKTATLRPPEP
jgi:hypothetical protein